LQVSTKVWKKLLALPEIVSALLFVSRKKTITENCLIMAALIRQHWFFYLELYSGLILDHFSAAKSTCNFN
jgi:hypothetical protein